MKISDAMSHTTAWRIHGKITASMIHACVQDSRSKHGKGRRAFGIAETARRLSIPSKTIANGVKQAQEDQDFTMQRPVSDR